ncbi:MAG: hypothetical protein GY803_16160 [Chloroflexi bacterium]|nr:hypothetical protein [Chloroflexota bacterium]
MGQNLVKQLLSGLKKMPLPTTPEATPQGLEAYRIGLDTVDSYKNDPKTLADALGTFRSGKSRPFTCAGVAYTLIAASREQDGSYAPMGLDAAMEWLEKAQETELDILLINMNEALIYIYGGRFDDARIILDYLRRQDASNYYLHVAEMVLGQRQGDVEMASLWYEQAVKSAVNAPQRLRLQSRMGDFYLEQGVLDKALVMFKEAVHFDKQNYRLWHKISVAFFRQGNFEEAQQYNQRVLRMNDYAPARQLEAVIEKELPSDTGRLGRFFGR